MGLNRVKSDNVASENFSKKSEILAENRKFWHVRYENLRFDAGINGMKIEMKIYDS